MISKVLNKYNLSNETLQCNVVAYKIRRGKNYIEKPILPIVITPIFDMLIAHHIADGTVVNPKNGRKPYFSYRQYNQNYKKLYLTKIESVFGRLNYQKDYFENTTEVYFPVVVSELMFKLYDLNVNSFKSEIARIPPKIFAKSWKHKLAFLIGMIIDEGHVDSTLIVVRLKNLLLVKDLQRLCNDFGYDTRVTEGKDGMVNLYLKSLSKFYKDYNQLLNEYPEVSLGKKEDKIKEFIGRLNKPRLYLPGNIEKVLKELSKESLSANDIAKKLGMTRQGARYLIRKLEAERKIKVGSIAKFGNWKYVVRKTKC